LINSRSLRTVTILAPFGTKHDMTRQYQDLWYKSLYTKLIINEKKGGKFK
jgi:hypothetical protein